MSNRSRRKKKRQQRRGTTNWMPWVWVAAAGAVVVILGALVVTKPWSTPKPAVTPEVVGGPRLRVDQAEVDEGYVKYDVPIRTTFRLSNVGDQPLKILDSPQVRLVEGC
jgi:hypothetical protein